MYNYSELELPKDSEIAMELIRRILWSKLPRKSFLSGLWLRTYHNTPLWANCFLHVLSGEKWKCFKYYYKNIVLVTPGESGLWTQGSEEDRIHYALTLEQESRGKATADWNKLKELESELIKEYAKYFPRTRGMLINYQYSLEEQGRIVGQLNRKYLLEISGPKS